MGISKKNQDFETQLAISELAFQVAQGLPLEKAASICNLDIDFAIHLASLSEFESKLKQVDPEYYKIWAESQKEDAVSASVRAMARNDGKIFYDQMKKLVVAEKDEKDSLPKKEKALILEKLLRLGGYFRDEEIREVVTLSPGHVRTIQEASRETSMSPEEWPLPADINGLQ